MYYDNIISGAYNMGKLTTKYRPKTLDDIKGQDRTIEFLKKYVERGSIGDMIIAGPPGTGKTSAVRAMLRQLYNGKDGVKQYTKTVNMSDSNKIDFVRGYMRDFAMAGSDKQRTFVGEEADRLRPDAQQALKSIIEDYEHNCAFIFIVNDPNKFIEAIHSRCPIYRFRPLPLEDTINVAERICRKENINISRELIEFVCKKYRGDMRRIINDAIEKFSLLGRKILDTDVKGLVSPAKIAADLLRERSGTNAVKIIEKQMKEDPLLEIREVLREMATMAIKLKVESVIPEIAEADARIVNGGDEHLQMVALLFKIQKLYK